MLLSEKLVSDRYFKAKKQDLLLHLYVKGEEIPLLDSGIWQVYRGVVQLSRISHRGKEVILGWATVNSAFSSLGYDNQIYRAVALGNVYVRYYTPQEIEKNPLLSRQLLAQLSDRLIKSEELLAIVGLRKVEDRLWELLCLLKQEMGQVVAGGTRIQIRFTHQNLADIICTTRVTVTRVLGEIQQKGWIDIDGDRHIIVKSKQ